MVINQGYIDGPLSSAPAIKNIFYGPRSSVYAVVMKGLIRYATLILFGNNLWLELFYFTLRAFIFSRSSCIAHELLHMCFFKGLWPPIS